MKKMMTFSVLFLLMIISGSLFGADSSLNGLGPYQESSAYQQYQLRPKSELSKLIYLMDRYRDTSFKVIFDGQEYDAAKALSYARTYLAKNYKKQNAIDWLKVHSYRSPAGEIIYIMMPGDSKKLILRDVLVGELQVIGG